MKGKITVALTVTVLALVSAPVLADDKKDIEAGYKKLENAFKARSLNDVMAVGTPDFSMKMAGTVMSTAQVKSQLKMSFDMMKTAPKITMTVKKMDIKKSSAEVLSTGIMHADVVDSTGMFGKKGAKHMLVDEQTSRDSWVKTTGGWKMKMTESLTEKMTVDGKPYNSAAPPSGGAPPK